MKIYTFLVIFFISSPFLSVFNFPLSVFMVFAFLGIFFQSGFIIKSYPLHRILFAYLLSIIILVYYYKSIHFLLFFSGFSVAYFIAISIDNYVVSLYIKWASRLLMVLLIGSIIGVISHFAGFKSFATFHNPNGDESLMYFLTLTNSNAGNLIRPSGFFAEPGYFGFIVASVLFLRQVYEFKLNLTFFLLFSTLVTQSLAYILFLLFFLIGILSLKSSSVKDIFKRYLFVIIGLVCGFAFQLMGVFDWVIERTVGFLNDELFNARSIGWIEIIESLKSSGYMGLFLGFDLDCILRNENCVTFGGIPLVPLLFGGLLYSWPYYLFIFYLFVIAVRNPRIRWVTVGYLIITLSQPVFLELPYSLIYLFVLVSIYSRLNFSRKSVDKMPVKNLSSNNNV
jgi:hypothetical protein